MGFSEKAGVLALAVGIARRICEAKTDSNQECAAKSAGPSWSKLLF